MFVVNRKSGGRLSKGSRVREALGAFLFGHKLNPVFRAASSAPSLPLTLSDLSESKHRFRL
jgi:hypothetical protein